MQIVQGRSVVLSQSVKVQQIAARSAILKQKGFDSPEYMQKVVADTRAVLAQHGEAIEEVCNLLNISDVVIAESQDLYIGNGELDTIDTAYIRKILDLSLSHPYKNTNNISLDKATFMHKKWLAKASARIAKDDTMGLFEDQIEFLQTINTMCCDIAREEDELSEADVQKMIDSHQLSQSDDPHGAKEHYDMVLAALKKQLE